ncbi:uncharacterized protein LOC130544081 [Ursus arctos]|uniref:uncharacterized protein LOC130544081 n=1 Tax=Ursus arctos TaxID=9644 RepID=UPI002548CDC4|nr:uncharacterized protein LOC130544081 [Ursus arctos]
MKCEVRVLKNFQVFPLSLHDPCPPTRHQAPRRPLPSISSERSYRASTPTLRVEREASTDPDVLGEALPRARKSLSFPGEAPPHPAPSPSFLTRGEAAPPPPSPAQLASPETAVRKHIPEPW